MPPKNTASCARWHGSSHAEQASREHHQPWIIVSMKDDWKKIFAFQ
jgi:hypothetical protein